MRPSNRSRILEAAMSVVERDGVTAVTFEAVAAEAGLTKGGLLYHFPSKEALLDALHRDLIARWEQAMDAELGGREDDEARRIAYVRIATQTATRAELALMVDAANTGRNAPWTGVVDRWSPTRDAVDHVVARLAADGLWLHESLGGPPLDAGLRRRVLDRLAELSGD